MNSLCGVKTHHPRSVRVGLFTPRDPRKTRSSPPWRHVFGHFSGGGAVLWSYRCAQCRCLEYRVGPRCSRAELALTQFQSECSTCVLYVVVVALCSQSPRVSRFPEYFRGKSAYLNDVLFFPDNNLYKNSQLNVTKIVFIFNSFVLFFYKTILYYIEFTYQVRAS